MVWMWTYKYKFKKYFFLKKNFLNHIFNAYSATTQQYKPSYSNLLFKKMTLNILLGTDGAAKWFNSLILIIHRSTY